MFCFSLCTESVFNIISVTEDLRSFSLRIIKMLFAILRQRNQRVVTEIMLHHYTVATTQYNMLIHQSAIISATAIAKHTHHYNWIYAMLHPFTHEDMPALKL